MHTPAKLLVRKELFNKDQINAKSYEHWQTDGKYLTYSRPDLNRVPAHMDTMPNASRTNNRDYRGAPIYTNPSDSKDFYRNEYFTGVDIKTDPRNIVRELRGAVFETKDDRGRAESNALMNRMLVGQQK
jgi:hypothetical protein